MTWEMAVVRGFAWENWRLWLEEVEQKKSSDIESNTVHEIDNRLKDDEIDGFALEI